MNLPHNVFRKLAPFFITVVIYFILLIPPGSPTFLAVIIKCSPIGSLMYFVISVGSRTNPILIGLLFCCLGDALLLFEDYFLVGMFAFVLGHLNYIRAFGLKPLKLRIGLSVFLLGGIIISLLYKGLSGLFVPGVSIYILIINTMVWRALARLRSRILHPHRYVSLFPRLSFSLYFKDSWTWIQISICTGSVLFAMSDFLIGINMFVRPIAHSQVLIMSSYYAAQLCISLSVLEIVPTENYVLN